MCVFALERGDPSRGRRDLSGSIFSGPKINKTDTNQNTRRHPDVSDKDRATWLVRTYGRVDCATRSRHMCSTATSSLLPFLSDLALGRGHKPPTGFVAEHQKPSVCVCDNSSVCWKALALPTGGTAAVLDARASSQPRLELPYQTRSDPNE